MRFVADTHVHLYPCHRIEETLKSLLKNLAGHDRSAVQLAFLAERSDCDYFAKLKSGEIKVNLDISELPSQPGVLLLQYEGRSCYLFAGRQIVSSERVEILGLMSEKHLSDGLPAKETVERLLEDGAIPVISWAPGKWFFKRKAIVNELLDSFDPGQLFLGDTFLRPTVWGTPILMKKGLNKGFSVLAGSDPLPFAGEERKAGIYAATFSGDCDQDKLLDSLRALFHDKKTVFTNSGRRGSLLQTLIRLYKNSQAKS